MAINLEREGVALNAAERNKRNANLTKIEDAINEVGAAVPAAEAAKLLSEEAKAQAIQAEERAAGVETQLNEIVVNGDSSVEAAQARVRSDGTVASTLKARLDGEHQEVTAQLAETDENVNRRVDELVLETGNANVEVTDAHVSTEKSKSFTTIRNRFEEIEKDTHFPATNEVRNNQFVDLADKWTPILSTSVVTNGKLVNTAGTTSATAYIQQRLIQTIKAGRKYYIKASIKPLNPDVFFLQVLVVPAGSSTNIISGRINSPAANVSHLVSAVGSSPTAVDPADIRVIHNYIDAATASGKAVEIESVDVIDLTTTFGAGNEPSKEQMDEIMKPFPRSSFSGSAQLSNFKHLMTMTLNAMRKAPGGGTGAPSADYVSVKSFGATGDGITNDTTAIRNAINSIGTTKRGVVVIPAGDYLVTSEIDVPENVSITGLGAGSRIKSTSNVFNLIGSHNGSSWVNTATQQTIDSGLRQSIRDLQIRGNRTGGAIRGSRLMQVALQSLHISNCTYGIKFTDRIRDVFISECTIWGNENEGILYENVNSHQSVIADSHISHNHGGGVVMRGGDVKNVAITGADIEYNGTTGGSGIAILFDVSVSGEIREMNVTGCQFNGNRVMVKGNAANVGKAGIIAITGNQIGTTSEGVAIEYASDISLSGNVYVAHTLRSIAIRYSENINISADNVSGNPAYGEASGILLSYCKSVNITGFNMKSERNPAPFGAIEVQFSEIINISNCMLTNIRASGVDLRECKVVKVSDCMFIDTAGNMTAGITVRGTTTENIFLLDNIIVGGTIAPINVESRAEHVKIRTIA